MRKRGLSLIEVVLGASLLSLVFLFMINLFPASMLGVRKAEHRLEAAAHAEAILDACRARPFVDLAPGIYTAGNLGLEARTTEDGVVLEPTLIIEPVPGIPADRLVRLQLTIAWNERETRQTLTQELRLADLNR